MTSSNRDFFELVKAIGESKSKQEEDRIVADEVAYLKKVVPLTTNSKKKMKELIIRALYVEMLGQDASFAYIKAVELCASTNIVQKRSGYLVAAVCFSPDHEFRFMLVNQIQRDMNSSNHLEICAALSAVCKIVTEDMIPAVIGDVLKLLRHEMEIVRKWAVCALHRLHQMDKSSVADHVDKVRRVLCDKDPCVMGASLPLIHDLVKDDVAGFKDLVPSLVSILKQITEHRLPREFDYHRIPAPWIQMELLKILALLGRGDQTSSEGMYEVLADVMRRADTGINVGYAIVFEVVHTVTTIYPNPLLLDAAATSISRFIRSDSHNLKYIGIKGLASIVKDHPKYAADHQMAVIDCLEDPDETLKRKTLDLLFRMTNSVNVEFIVEKLLSFLASATADDHFRTDLVGQITQCAERFAPSNAWYVQTMVKVFELAGDKVKMSVAQTLMQLIAEGSEQVDDDDDDEGGRDEELRTEAVEDFLQLLSRKKAPTDILAQAIAWVLGEYGYLSTTCSKEEIIDKLCALAHQTKDASTRGHVVSAIMKLVAQSGSCPKNVHQLINRFRQSIFLDVQQRCVEFLALLSSSSTMADVLPVDASCEDIEVDEQLGFLNGYVQQALNYGAKPYSPPSDLNLDEDTTKEAVLKMTPYEKPTAPVAAPSLGIMSAANPTPMSQPTQPTVATTVGQGNQLLNSRIGAGAAVWGRKPDPVSEPPPPPAPSVAAATQPVQSTNVEQLPVQAAPPAPVSDGPKVLSEKEKMAAALFGGVSGSASKASGRRRSTATSGVAAQTPKPENPAATSMASVPVSAPSSNLFDLLDSTTSSAAVPSSGQELDILSLGPPSTPPHPQPISIPAATPALSPVLPPINDLFASLSVGAAASSTGARPQPMNTSEFGQRWGRTPAESKQGFPCRIQTLQQLQVAMPQEYARVDSIAASLESIFACTTSLGGIALIHVKLFPTRMGCDVTVKSGTRESCLLEMNAIGAALSGFNSLQ